MTSGDWNAGELMSIVAARQLRDGMVCFVGIGLPSEAANLARLTHAPGCVLVYESGTIGSRPDVLPLSIGDGILADTAVSVIGVPEIFGYWLQAGRIDVGFLTAAQIDRFGNLNTTVVGEYDTPTVRLPGAGGAPEIATSSGEIFVTMRHTRRSFVESLDFVTSLGHGRDGRTRSRWGIVGRGPTIVITDLCVMRPDPETMELTVIDLHPGVSAEDVVEATGWQVRFADRTGVTEAPTVDELSVLRRLRARTSEAHSV